MKKSYVVIHKDHAIAESPKEALRIVRDSLRNDSYEEGESLIELFAKVKLSEDDN